MALKGFLGTLFADKPTKEDQSYQWKTDREGLNFFIKPEILKQIEQNKADDWVMQQHITLKMLAEQGDAEALPVGFVITPEVIVQLDNFTREILELPDQWSGTMQTDIKGHTGRNNFSVNLKLANQSSNHTGLYKVDGAILTLSSAKYILTSAQYMIFSALELHRCSEKSEYDNLALILALKDAQEMGASINLTHFDKLDLKAPENISIEVETDEEGNLILTPFMGQNASHEKVQRVLGQLRNKKATALRVNNEIILFDETRLKAVHEIITKRKVPKNKVKQFLENPTAFIDASLVDLESGFSVRVHGATTFKHAYFGETDETDIDWFGSKNGADTVFPISKLSKHIEDEATLEEFKTKLKDAQKTGADELNFVDKNFDISDKEAVSKTFDKIKDKIINGIVNEDDNDEIEEEKEQKTIIETVVVDIDLNDDITDIGADKAQNSITDILYPINQLDWSNYLRTPFPHQETGIAWILGVALAKDNFGGGLLADDMGLGKTMMALAAQDQLYKIQARDGETQKPCLLVAPLSLLENWKDEVEATFSTSPFNDIVILQSKADLPRFRVGGAETKQEVVEDGEVAEIKYSLKVGQHFFQDRLDMPKRFVITTYQTLRDYQFSLCRIDWGMVIFDEAQNIKNPNALQTRAAKGLKADFKLVATGTPVENSLADFWCLMDTACPGYLNNYQDFRDKYIRPIIQAAGDEVTQIRNETGELLRQKSAPLMLRRIKEDNIEGLPEKRIFVGIKGQEWDFNPALSATMETFQLEIYNATLSAQEEAESNMVLGALQRLRDISLHPQLADQGQLNVPKGKGKLTSLLNESGKMISLQNTLTQIQSRGEKCIIFAVNKRLQRFLSLSLGQRYGLGSLPVINGDTKAIAKRKSVPTRKSLIKDFEAKEGFNIIIMSPVAAGVGLTIIGANNVIHLERHWNPAKEAQATDRVYRIGQKKDVNVYIPVLHHPEHESFDVNLHKLLSKKTSLKDAVIVPDQVVPNPEGFDHMELGQKIEGKDLARLSWQHFEALCAELFAQHYKASSTWLTPNQDYGADVVLIAENAGILVQSKHTKSSKYDGHKAITEIFGAKRKYGEELDKAIQTLIFATNAKTVSPSTRKIAKQYDVEIFAYKELSALLSTHMVTYQMVITRIGKNRIKC